MEEQREPTWNEAWHRKQQWAQQIDRKITHLAFLMCTFMVIGLVLYLLPISGTAYLLTNIGGLVCVLFSIAFGVRAVYIRSRATKQIESYSQAMDLPLPEKSTSPQWEDKVLRWAFRILTSLAFLVALAEIALLWQELPAIHGHLIILVVTLLTMVCGFLMLLITKIPEK